MKKIISIILAILLCFSLLVSCTKNIPQKSTDETAAQTENTESETSKEEEYEFEHWLARELESGDENDDYILVPTGMIDMDELVMTDVTLEIPFQLLCREDCKGLCPVCGSDLNVKTCNCNQKQIDPRLEKLKMLLDS